MSQIFPRSANAIARFTLVGVLLFGGLVASIVGMAFRSDYVTGANANIDSNAYWNALKRLSHNAIISATAAMLPMPLASASSATAPTITA